MKTVPRAASLLCVAMLTGVGPQAAAHAGLQTPSEPAFGIHATTVSACGQVLMKYWTPADTPVDVFRSVDGGPWEPLLRDPNPRFDHVVEPVRYKVMFDKREAMTDIVNPHRCQGA